MSFHTWQHLGRYRSIKLQSRDLSKLLSCQWIEYGKKAYHLWLFYPLGRNFLHLRLRPAIIVVGGALFINRASDIWFDEVERGGVGGAFVKWLMKIVCTILNQLCLVLPERRGQGQPFHGRRLRLFHCVLVDLRASVEVRVAELGQLAWLHWLCLSMVPSLHEELCRWDSGPFFQWCIATESFGALICHNLCVSLLFIFFILSTKY